MSQSASGSSRFSFASGANLDYIESLYQAFKRDPMSVDDSWRKFFEGYELAAHGDVVARLDKATGSVAAAPHPARTDAEFDRDTAKVEALINAYRRLGHLSAHLNPLAPKPALAPELTPAGAGLGSVDGKRRFHPSNLPNASLTFDEIMSLLQDTYTSKIGADFRELNDVEMVTWFQDQMESCRNRPTLTRDQKHRILTKLTHAESFEQFLGRRYIGAKRFSLEGADALIPMLDLIATESARAGCEEIVLGMAHRGRLNVLANFMGKSYELILKEFEGSEFTPFDIDGDVKYHMGFASEVGTAAGQRIRLYLSPNPSHLEQVNPVVEGFARARQRLIGDKERTRVLPILMHGDAAFPGQGIVSETLNLSQLPAYTTGGTIHVIINNQIGFTTEPDDSRSTTYSSDIAKMVRAPVLHVNADDPEAVAWCAQLAAAFRQKFKQDIIIDLIGYRRHGHNEGDEPAFTQPVMYKTIAKHPTALTQYVESLVTEGSATKDECERESESFRNKLQVSYEAVHGVSSPKLPAPVIPAALQRALSYRKATREEVAQSVPTGVPMAKLKHVVSKITTVPQGFTPNPKLLRLLEQRAKMLDGKGSVDWGMGELLAFGTLALEGRHVRLTGQDVCRGTFTHRHAVWFDFNDNRRYDPMNTLDPAQGWVHIANSALSEAGCVGFEFGYSVADPDSLVVWEAQFGDFVNGAQIMIDQFLSASEAKWKQCSGLVFFLPHGYEGQGPEHSSARPERFLQLCGNLNLQVAFPTTPAQHFHALRRQLHRDFRKPLVLMTPKSLLREPLCVSTSDEFEKSVFQEVLDDSAVKGRDKVERAIFCSGKIYYDLLKAREADKASAGVPLIRLEQLYPFPYARMEKLLEAYPRLSEIVWVQEEPQNMGAWQFVRGRLLEVIKPGQKLTYVGRKNSGTPAEGYLKAHEAEQKRIINDAFAHAMGVRATAAATGK
jgi:2-oxoglutarate dehydrogenase E1 component